MTWDVLSSVVARLRDHQSALADDPLGRPPSVAAILAESRRRSTMLAMMLGGMLAIGIWTGGMLVTGHWVAPASLRPLKTAVDATGVDIVRLSSADLTARLATPDEIIRILVEFKSRGDLEHLEQLTLWLANLPKEIRYEVASNLGTIAMIGAGYGVRYVVAQRILKLDVDVLEELNFILYERPNFFTALARVPREARLGIVDTDFPIRPVDDARAKLWRLINDARFPADDLIRPLSEVARLDPVRLEMVRRWASQPGPLPSCAPVACYDVQFMCQRGAHPVCQRDR